MKTPTQILVVALAELERHGWTKGVLGTKSGAKCAAGAINYADTGSPQDNSRTSAANRAGVFLGRAAGKGWWDIASWNDHPERTFDQIKSAFQKAIKLAKGDQ